MKYSTKIGMENPKNMINIVLECEIIKKDI